MRKGNYDMSQAACRERADHAKEHEALKEVCTSHHEMILLNRASIEAVKSMFDCLKLEIESLKEKVND